MQSLQLNYSLLFKLTYQCVADVLGTNIIVVCHEEHTSCGEGDSQGVISRCVSIFCKMKRTKQMDDTCNVLNF